MISITENIKNALITGQQELKFIVPYLSKDERTEISDLVAEYSVCYSVSFTETPVIQGHGGDVEVHIVRLEK